MIALIALFVSTKKKILQQLNFIIDKRIEELLHNIASFKESRDQDTKSSAGDKYETGRAMIQMEIDNSESQLIKNRQLKHDISKIDADIKNESINLGSLVHTNTDIYFISIGIGKINVDENPIYAISLASPIGVLLKGKKVGDTIQIQEKKIKILKLD